MTYDKSCVLISFCLEVYGSLWQTKLATSVQHSQHFQLHRKVKTTLNKLQRMTAAADLLHLQLWSEELLVSWRQLLLCQCVVHLPHPLHQRRNRFLELSRPQQRRIQPVFSVHQLLTAHTQMHRRKQRTINSSSTLTWKRQLPQWICVQRARNTMPAGNITNKSETMYSTLSITSLP